MNQLGTIKFSGESGVRYAFAAYPLETIFDEAFSGVYVVTRRREGKSRKGFAHKRLCTGHSDDLRQLFADDERDFSQRGANCICVHAEKNESAMRTIEKDLIHKPPARSA